jgi:hypothetical protein
MSAEDLLVGCCCWGTLVVLTTPKVLGRGLTLRELSQNLILLTISSSMVGGCGGGGGMRTFCPWRALPTI